MKKNKELLSLDDREIDRAVKIVSTQWDRKRKLTDKQIETAQRLFTKKNRSFEQIAKKFHVDPRTIRYHLDNTYRCSRIAQARSASYTPPALTGYDAKERLKERAAYKRQLVARGRVNI